MLIAGKETQLLDQDPPFFNALHTEDFLTKSCEVLKFSTDLATPHVIPKILEDQHRNKRKTLFTKKCSSQERTQQIG